MGGIQDYIGSSAEKSKCKEECIISNHINIVYAPLKMSRTTTRIKLDFFNFDDHYKNMTKYVHTFFIPVVIIVG